MYRRYYRNYNSYNGQSQRPIGETSEEMDAASEDTDTQEHMMESQMTYKPEIIVPEKPSQHDDLPHVSGREATAGIPAPRQTLTNFFSRFGIDDLILLALIFLFLQEGVQNEGILIVLAFLFFAGL